MSISRVRVSAPAVFRSLPFDEAFRPNPQEYAMIEPAASGHHQHQSGQGFHGRRFPQSSI